MQVRGGRGRILELLLLQLLELLQLLQLLKLLELLKLVLLLHGSILCVLRLVGVATDALIHYVGGLSSCGVNDGVDVRLGPGSRRVVPSLVVAVHGVLLLLLELKLLADGKTLELLSGGLDIAQLLLKALLLLGKVRVRGDQLRIDTRVHLLLSLHVELKLGRGENLLSGVLLAQVGERVERLSLVALVALVSLVPLVPQLRQSSLRRVVDILGGRVSARVVPSELLLRLLRH